MLVVPVPPLEELVRARHEYYDRDYVSADPTFAHAHITVLGPLVELAQVPRVVARIAEIARRTAPFEVRLQRVATFPNGIIHLVPEPTGPLRALTAAAVAAFPGHPPYAGAHGVVSPHATIDAVGEQVSEASVRDWVAALVPIALTVDRLHLSWYEPGACRTLARWTLTGSGESALSLG